MAFPKPSEIHADVRTMCDLLAATPVGSIITYSTLSEAIGYPVQLKRYNLVRALRLANQENGALFAVIRSQGYQRLAASDAYLVGHVARRRIRNKSRTTQSVITRTVEMANEITDEGKVRAYSELAVLGLIQHIAADRVVSKVVARQQPLSVPLVMQAALAVINGSA